MSAVKVPPTSANGKASTSENSSSTHRRPRKPQPTPDMAPPRLQVDLDPDEPFDPYALFARMRIELESFATTAGLFIMRELMRLETEQLAGERYQRATDVDRWGCQSGFVRLGGQKLEVDRPRVRAKSSGREVPLETYEAFQDPTHQADAVYQRLIGGLSGRRYEQTVEQVVDGYGVSRSAVSRQMIRATAERVRELQERDLTAFDVQVLLIDGVRVGGSVHTVALGVDTGGRKMVLGFREGATENAVVVTELLAELVARGLPNEPSRRLLAVIDGSKALAKALRDVYGSRIEIQRCHVHKLRNVTDHLPERYRGEYHRKISAAWAMRSYADALRALRRIVRELERINVSASRSLEEGLEETLTLHRLDVPEDLRRSLRSTNMIESIFSHSRHMMRNVKRWRGSDHSQRWTAAVLLENEKKFRRIQGYKHLPTLKTALMKTHG